MKMPTDAKKRKGIPLATGLLDYFPDALCEAAILSLKGNEQHNPGEPLHWSKDKSKDHADCILRHMIDRGTRDTDGVRHSVKVLWRAAAMVQTEIEAEREQARIDQTWVDASLDDPAGRIVNGRFVKPSGL